MLHPVFSRLFRTVGHGHELCHHRRVADRVDVHGNHMGDLTGSCALHYIARKQAKATRLIQICDDCKRLSQTQAVDLQHWDEALGITSSVIGPRLFACQ